MSSTETSPDRRRLRVELEGRGYDIVIGSGLLERAGECAAPLLARPRTVIVTDENVAGLHLSRLQEGLAAGGVRSGAVILPPGEATKSFAHLERLCGELLERGVERRDTIIAFGGGVTGDLTGFAAAILRRGIRFIQIPTTLLAQVDSSVGGKTGINTAQGKNLVGAFHQPSLVLADLSVLKTLPRRERLSGYAEVVKYAVLGDRAFFDWLEAHGADVLEGEPAATAHAVETSCRMKAAIVAADEREGGRRALLNLGHTFGHALEAATGYSERLTHGEAVAAGMGLACDLSERLGHAPPGTAAALRAHLQRAGLPSRLADIPGAPVAAGELLHHMRQDKKARGGRPVFILVRNIGEAFIAADVPLSEVEAVLSHAVRSAAAP
ncbi:MAG: 3-dehydroquinate synthase [Alphaproteobacteria bacterium]